MITAKSTNAETIRQHAENATPQNKKEHLEEQN